MVTTTLRIITAPQSRAGVVRLSSPGWGRHARNPAAPGVIPPKTWEEKGGAQKE